jgi:predicted TIM-barrel fold metal-dependent hydrolase
VKIEGSKYIDMHVHFFPPNLFNAIWTFFEKPDENGKPQGWNVRYKLPTRQLVQVLDEERVIGYTTFAYAHKKGVATYINDWLVKFSLNHKKALPFGCIWPGDNDKFEYVSELFSQHDFFGIKIQPLVQNFYPSDSRLDKVYKLIVDEGKWLVIHAGTAPYANKYVGYDNFLKLMKKYPNMNVIVAHLGTYEHEKFLKLLDSYENLYLDTAMVYVPEELFNRWSRNITLPSPEDLLHYQDRILYGSDFPNIPYEYKKSIEGLLDLGLTRNFYEDIFYNNANRLFNLF